jgi:hypothetical protein
MQLKIILPVQKVSGATFLPPQGMVSFEGKEGSRTDASRTNYQLIPAICGLEVQGIHLSNVHPSDLLSQSFPLRVKTYRMSSGFLCGGNQYIWMFL